MSKEITVAMLDRTIQLCRQNAFWGKPSAVPRVLDFYFEKTRTSVKEDWPDAFSFQDLARALGEDPVRYRIYYSRDNSTAVCIPSSLHLGRTENHVGLGVCCCPGW